ncbi:MAG TPA: energy transducer TonB [Labilithrix sp.]|nr:energy transducer TonB [Labilithrix sp.]
MRKADRRRDPFFELLKAARRDRQWFATALVAAVACHLTVVRGATLRPRSPQPLSAMLERPTEVIDVDVRLSPPPPPPVEPETIEPPSKAPSPSRSTSPIHAAPTAPARAAEVLTKQSEADGPLDLTDTIVTGTAAAYAGGTTTSTGTNPSASHSGGASTNGSGRFGTDGASRPPYADVDRSRPPRLASDLEWRCPFPTAADTDNIDHAVVTLRVEVDSVGRSRSATVVTDPGHGFGQEARRCAMSKAWTPALDRSGSPVDGSVTVRVRFDR